MSRQPNKSFIGGFVIGAIVLLVAGLMVFGSGKFFTKTHKFVLFFDDSVKGLQVGAPVMFRGVQIGRVENIYICFDPKKLTADIPVLISLDPSAVRIKGGGEGVGEHLLENLDKLIDRGLRAQLQIQSFVTGQLMIELDFYPDTAFKTIQTPVRYPQIPTIPSPLQRITKAAEELPIQEIAMKLVSALSGIEKIINREETVELTVNLNQLLIDLKKLTQDMDSHLSAISTSVNKTASEYRELAKHLNQQVEALTKVLIRSASAIESSARQADRTLSSANEMLGDDSRLNIQLIRALQDVSDAARALKNWADYMEQHPEAFIKGKIEDRGNY